MTCTQGAEPVNGGKPGVDGVLFRTKTTASMTFRKLQDGVLVGEKTFEPAYAVEPGPNGPHCEPKVCVLAETTFP